MEMFDLHCDTITVCMEHGKELRNNDLHIDLETLPRGDKWCQAFAIFILDDLRGRDAVDYFNRCLATYSEQMEKNSDLISRVQSYEELQKCFAEGKFASILAVEGGAALGGRLEMVDYLRQCGVRLLTLTWNGANEIASGSVTEQGISDFGRQAIARMEQQGIIVDVSHLNDNSFADLCKIATKPFIATHSNSRSICGHLRNLTDEQFCEIRDRGGLVGMNYYRSFITDDGVTNDIGDLIKHIKHFLALGGEDVIALGSDFDGADIPEYLNSLGKVENLAIALRDAGIEERIIHKIFFENADNFFRKYL